MSCRSMSNAINVRFMLDYKVSIWLHAVMSLESPISCERISLLIHTHGG